MFIQLFWNVHSAFLCISRGGGGCFCLRYLLSDQSCRIALTQKPMEMDFCIVFCAMIHATMKYLFIYSTSAGQFTRMTCIQYKYNIIQVTNGGDTTTVILKPLKYLLIIHKPCGKSCQPYMSRGVTLYLIKQAALYNCSS
jgi:hypothetical protein